MGYVRDPLRKAPSGLVPPDRMAAEIQYLAGREIGDVEALQTMDHLVDTGLLIEDARSGWYEWAWREVVPMEVTIDGRTETVPQNLAVRDHIRWAIKQARLRDQNHRSK